MNLKELKYEYLSKIITLEILLDEFQKNGISPAIINDDFGRWQVCTDGFQQIPEGIEFEPQDLHTTFIAYKEDWRDSIEDAVVHFLDKCIEEEE